MRRTTLVATPLLVALVAFVALVATAVPLRADEESEPKAPSAPEINRLIGQLGASDFAVREKASRDLLAIGEPAREALERTMKQSDNMEARWRAEQILRRLDREGERPMGPGNRPAPAPVPPGPPPEGTPSPDEDLGGLTPGRGWAEMERRLEELMRRGLGAPMPFADRSTILEAPGLRLEVTALGLFATVELRVENYPGLFLGRSLEDLLVRHPELEKHESMAQLRERWDAYKKEHPQLFPFENTPFGPGPGRGQSGFSISIGGSGVEYTQTPEGVKVKIRDRDADGNVTEREYEGESLDEIRRQHPEIAERLQGFSTITIGPQIFRGGGLGRRLPVPLAEEPPVVTPSEPAAQRAPFGVQVAPVEPVLAVQLGLEAGHGILVVDVIQGSLAEKMGVLRYDVIVGVDGNPVTDYAKGVETLRAGGTSNAIQALEVIRRGKRVPLTR